MARRAGPSRETVARRRRAALGTLAGLSLLAGIVAGAVSGGDPGEGREPYAAAPECPGEIAADPRRLVGQQLVVRMEAIAAPELLRDVARGLVGGVVLFPPSGTAPATLGREVAQLRRAAERAGSPPPLVSIDQEGGEVERLPQLPPRRGAPQLAEPREALAEGVATGEALAARGIGMDLAPVLDVPAGDQALIASRAFGREPGEVAAAGVAFAQGLERGGVAASAKHFPGLGEAAINTDEAPSAIAASRAELRSGWVPFEAAIAAEVDSIMVANATYPALDPDRPASLSPRVVGRLLRDRLGFDGVVITDDLGAGALTGAGIDEGEAAVGAARAGADLLLFALSDGRAARRALSRALRSGDLDRGAMLASCARTVALRQRLSG